MELHGFILTNEKRLNKAFAYCLTRELNAPKEYKHIWRNLANGIRNKYTSLLQGETI